MSLDTNYESNTITATLKNEFRSDLVGRYTCSETINDKKYETSAYIFIQGRIWFFETNFVKKFILDGTTVFTKKLYPKVLQQTGIHFFNLPCQTTSWYPRMSCPIVTDSTRCRARECSAQERKVMELKCNIPICDGEDICIPVYYTPSDLQASVGFDYI